MAYLIDSDVATDHLADVPAVASLLDELTEDGIAIAIISYVELFQGAERSADPADAHAKLRELSQDVPVLPLSQAVAERCARLRELLRRQGKQPRRRALDLTIAATAFQHGLTLVTRNTDDYEEVPGLTLRHP